MFSTSQIQRLWAHDHLGTCIKSRNKETKAYAYAFDEVAEQICWNN